MAENKGVLICGELVEGKLTSIATELLAAGRRLADDLGEELSAVLFGSGIGDEPKKEAVAFGADKVYVVDAPLFENYQTDSYVAGMEKVCQKLNPRILLLGQTSMGRDLAPRLAFRLGTGLGMDCVNLEIDPESKLLVQTRPVYGGNAIATQVCETGCPQMATVRAKTVSPLEPDDSRKGEVVPLDIGVDSSVVRTTFLERVAQEVAGVKLEDADTVVCGGRGLGGGEAFKDLEELAKLLGGAVGATRPPCDSNWVPATLQVGLTGKLVTPNLYIGVALSGSSQHLAGCSGAKTIVAINRDPDANIFNVAQFGVVGDYRKVLPAFTQKCKELLSE